MLTACKRREFHIAAVIHVSGSKIDALVRNEDDLPTHPLDVRVQRDGNDLYRPMPFVLNARESRTLHITAAAAPGQIEMTVKRIDTGATLAAARP